MSILKKLSAATVGTALAVFGIGGTVQANIALNDAPKPVKPVLEGVYACPDGTYTALFGYKNENTDTVVIPVGRYNRFHPNPQDRNQITTFAPGRSYGAFTVKLQEDTLVWILGTPQGGTRTSTASKANASSVGACPI